MAKQNVKKLTHSFIHLFKIYDILVEILICTYHGTNDRKECLSKLSTFYYGIHFHSQFNSVLGDSFELYIYFGVYSRIFVLVTFCKSFAQVGVRTQIQGRLPLLVLDAKISPISS